MLLDIRPAKISNNARVPSRAPFKTLGIWFSDNDDEMAKLNFEKKIEKMENLTNTWTARHLSLKAKVMVIKSLILPQISHLLPMCYCPHTMLEKLFMVLIILEDRELRKTPF